MARSLAGCRDGRDIFAGELPEYLVHSAILAHGKRNGCSLRAAGRMPDCGCWEVLVKNSVNLLLAACLMTGSSSAMSAAPGQHCGKFSSTDEVSAPLTIAEIEQEEMATLSDKLNMRPDYPRVPFGFMHAEWIAFKALIRPGDKIVRYSTDYQSWQDHAGETGYALMRSGCVIETFETMWN